MELGLLYYGARFYVPGLGRFASADTIVPNPANPQSYNRYSYVGNRPLNFSDPTGHCEFGLDENGEQIITRFDCSLDEFDALPAEQRLLWMQIFMRQIPGTTNWFNNIAGILEGFVQFGLAESGSWLSIVDAGILQGIQDGYTLKEGTATYSSANPGSLLWKDFFSALGDEAPDNELVNLWGAAEQESTNYGMSVATDRNILPNMYEWGFLLTGNIYRGAASTWEGGLGTPTSFITAAIGGATGVDGDLSVDAGYKLGRFFNDPRSLWNGHSPVYWYSTLIWEMRETH
jgi:RHS repeat-associated protein